MKNKKLFFLPVALFALAVPLLGAHFYSAKEYVEPDDIEYSDDLVRDFNNPDVKYESKGLFANESATSIAIHYHNEDAQNDKREFWVWCPGRNGSAFAPTTVSADKKDMVLSFEFTGENKEFAKKKSISFIVKKIGSWVGQSDNVLIEYKDHVPNASGLTEIWTIPGEGNAIEVYDSEAETKMDRFVNASFTDWRHIKIIATTVPQTYRLYALTSNYMSLGSTATKDDLNRYLIKKGQTPTCTDVTYNSMPCKQFTIELNFTAKVNVQYYLEGVFPEYQSYTKTKYVSSAELYETARFKQYYEYKGDDLGATFVNPKETTFKVWAPTAARVRLMVYKSGTPEEIGEQAGVAGDDSYSGYNMVFQPGGVWAITITNKNMANTYYNYYVVNSLGISEVTDPYAKAVGVNGSRGMVLSFPLTDPDGWASVPKIWDGEEGYDIEHPNDLSIYETHIRDLTMDESWKGTSTPGTYSAFVESGTTVTVDGTVASTGFDHITELGVKAVQLEPVFDSDNLETPADRTYNWGYNPLNYNCVDGSYATDPFNGASRITEFKKMVMAFAKNGNHTRVIMDVVYNHVSSAPASCFNKLMPKYYFRYASDGTYYDGSGCGNEVKTEAPMMRKYIVDSLCWWASEYKIKGFRFDLMGLIDVGTLNEARKALYAIDPDIILYGEGWTGDSSGYDYNNGDIYQVHGHEDTHSTSTTTPQQAYDMSLGAVTSAVYRFLYPTQNACYVGAFNDAGRNGMRGDNNLDKGWGFIDQGSGDVGDKSSAVADMMIGYHKGMGGNPNQCVNYASCHDNFTLFDQLSYGISGSATSVGLACAAVSAVECAIMFSNGIAFIHGGEEVFRTKEVKSDADKALVKESDTHMINGKLICHNSYNLSDDVNAYRWDRKVKIGSTVTKGYVEELAKAIHARNNLKKYSYDDLQAHSPYSDGSPFNVWGYGSGKTSIGIKNESYFCFISGVNSDTIPFGAYYEYPHDLVFTSNKTPDYNGYEEDQANNGIRLGWYTTVCFLLH